MSVYKKVEVNLFLETFYGDYFDVRPDCSRHQIHVDDENIFLSFSIGENV